LAEGLYYLNLVSFGNKKEHSWSQGTIKDVFSACETHFARQHVPLLSTTYINRAAAGQKTARFNYSLILGGYRQFD